VGYYLSGMAIISLLALLMVRRMPALESSNTFSETADEHR
jgi:hypothetical protein